MTTILICWIIGALLPYLWASASIPFRSREFGTVDLRTPRVQGEQLTDGGARVVGAQGNAWEALIVFSAANTMAIWAGVDPPGSWASLAVGWAAARVAHGVFYVADVPVGRIVGFLGGLICSVSIAVMAVTA